MAVTRVFLVLCLFSRTAAADWDDFRSLLGMLREKGVSLVDAGEADLIIVLGPAPRRVSPKELRQTVGRGATLVIATETERAHPLLAEFSLTLESDFVFCGPFSGFMRQEDCPLVTDFDRELLPGLFEGVSAIATNQSITWRAALPIASMLMNITPLVFSGMPTAR